MRNSADLNRPDVGAQYPPFGATHGFDRYSPVDIGPWPFPNPDDPPLSPGPYDLCALAVSAVTNATNLGCARVTVTQAMLENWWPPAL